MFDDPGDNDDFDQFSDEEIYGHFPYPLDDKPDGKLGDIFDQNGWDSWRDFADQHLGQQHAGDPDSFRPGVYADPADFIFDMNASGAMDWANVWYDPDDDLWHYEVESST